MKIKIKKKNLKLNENQSKEENFRNEPQITHSESYIWLTLYTHKLFKIPRKKKVQYVNEESFGFNQNNKTKYKNRW